MAFRIAGFMLVAFVASAQTSKWFTPSQGTAASTTSKNRYKVSGTVTNSVSGEPIPRALVSGPGLVNGPVFTDASGKFEVDDVPEGPTFFSAQRPGFFPEGVGQRGGYRSPITPNVVDASHKSINVKLVPGGTIRGRVTDSDNQPVDSLQVQLVTRANSQFGMRRWQPMNAVTTDDTGAFTFNDLIPGTYLIRSLPRRLYQDNSDLVIDGQHYPDIYVASYFPDAAERASAQQINLPPGGNYEADLHIRLVPTYSISGITPAGFRGGVHCANEEGEMVSTQASIDPRSGRFHLAGVPPGTCNLVAQSFGPQGRGPSAEKLITVASADVNDVTLVLSEPLADIPITVSGAPPGQKGSPITVNLVPRSERPAYQTQVQTQAAPDGSVQYFIRNPLPGSYRLMASAAMVKTCVTSIRTGSTDLMKEDLVITRDSAPAGIEIGLSSDCGTVAISMEGTAPTDPVGILSVGGASPNMIFFSGGNLTLPYVSPGDYTFYAFHDAGDLEYGNPEVLKKYSGQRVTVNSSDKTTVQLKVQTVQSEAAP